MYSSFEQLQPGFFVWYQMIMALLSPKLSALQAASMSLRRCFSAAGLALFASAACMAGQTPPDPPAAIQPSELFTHVIAQQKKSEIELEQFERVQRIESRKPGGDTATVETRVFRLFPNGTGLNKLPFPPDGKTSDSTAYRAELEKLEKYLAWIVQDGSSQRDAYAKAERRRKERFDLIESTHQAFDFTFEGKEMRGSRQLLRYAMVPRKDYRPTSRMTTLFTKVRGTLWIDEQTSQLAKVEGEVTDDVSLAIFLAKVNKGSHFMQERYEIAPGVWEPSFEQYDFDGRRFFSSFSIHERTFYTDYKRVGPPRESLPLVRAELGSLSTQKNQ